MRRNKAKAVIDGEAETSNSGECRRGAIEKEARKYIIHSQSQRVQLLSSHSHTC